MGLPAETISKRMAADTQYSFTQFRHEQISQWPDLKLASSDFTTKINMKNSNIEK